MNTMYRARRLTSQSLLLILVFITTVPVKAQLVDKTPAPIPHVPEVYNAEPWQDQHVSGINREPSHATAYSFNTVADALAGDRNASRMMSLNGEWDFSFALKPT